MDHGNGDPFSSEMRMQVCPLQGVHEHVTPSLSSELLLHLLSFGVVDLLTRNPSASRLSTTVEIQQGCMQITDKLFSTDKPKLKAKQDYAPK